MSDLLAIVEGSSTDEELVLEIIRRHPDRVTILLEGGPDLTGDDSPLDRALRARLIRLRTAIEARTGAIVVGLADSREQLRGWRFDRVIGGRQSAPLSTA